MRSLHRNGQGLARLWILEAMLDIWGNFECVLMLSEIYAPVLHHVGMPCSGGFPKNAVESSSAVHNYPFLWMHRGCV